MGTVWASSPLDTNRYFLKLNCIFLTLSVTLKQPSQCPVVSSVKMMSRHLQARENYAYHL